MLCLLRIKHFALIDQLELEFGPGLNVLTGETGAGKSIILDAIDVVLGGKISSRMIRTGNQRSIIEATFQGDRQGRAFSDRTLQEWLEEQEIDPLDDGSLVCSRELAIARGTLRSRARVNGVLVNRKLMVQLRDRLVEITAQGQTVQLMVPLIQRELLDSYGGKSLLLQRQQVESAYQVCQGTQEVLEKRLQSEQQRLQRLDMLEYQLKELEDADFTDGEELEQLEQERERLSHVVELQQLSYQVYQLLYQNDRGDAAVADLLGEGESLLTDMVEYDGGLEPILDIVKTALTQIVEAGQQINGYGEGLEADPERLGEVEERIQLLKRICRKYGPSLAEAISYYEKLQQELAELNDSGQSLEDLEIAYNQAQEKLTQVCAKLTHLRQQAAQKLAKQLVKELKPLAMDKVIFECRLTPCPPNIAGSDRVDYYFSPNAGEKVQPLSRIASGGEMSRFLLALKACFSESDNQSGTLIFDEIDAGVSGKVAQAIAAKLHQLSLKHQVLCVTHQPLVAAMADSHFRVEKETVEEISDLKEDNNGQLKLPDIRTVIRVLSLDNHDTRRTELAQLTGGHSAEDAIAFAESLLTKAAADRAQNSV